MDRLHAMEVFVAVAEAGRFSRAAQRLRLSPAAVTRTVTALEDRLGARLMTRTTRSLTLTESGLRFLESAKRLLQEFDEAEKVAAGETAVPTGHLTVTASVTFGRSHVAPVLSGYLREHPRVSASLLLLDRVANLVEEGIDVAIRIGELPDSSLVARQVGAVRRLLVASPDYLEACGMPRDPEDLKAHSIIAFTSLLPNREWRFVRDGRSSGVTLAPRLELNDAVAAIAAAESGDGITVALSYMVADAVRQGRLVPVLDGLMPGQVPVHLLYPHSRIVAAKVRSFIDFTAPRLRRTLNALDLAPSGLPAAAGPAG
ncbi:LysR family transcriptional regulator [Arenibaculum sp.]|uniref:LysR family transcriptional regulator n=1 Tax=Arenibaculum sp. TaxID=2865862 RepID=UPI002E0DFD00|nr:LysR family transcriptional regulator [Arenibaculum sp.]